MEINLETVLKQASNWTFAGDFQLLQWMNKLSEDLESRAKKTTENLDQLSNVTTTANVALDNVANSLTALQYGNQFVECRVQDDDETTGHGNDSFNNGVVQNEKPTSKKILADFLDNNLRLLRNCHEKYSIDIDDSDEEDEQSEKTCIFQPINPYNERPLPHIFGSKEWQAKWHVGLSSDQQDNCYSGDEISDAFSESSSSAAADNDSYESNSECASSFSLGNDNNIAGSFEVRNASSFLHSKVSNRDHVRESSSTDSSTDKIKSVGFTSKSESASSSNSKIENSHVAPIIPKDMFVDKPDIFKSNLPPYMDLFAEPPEDLGSSPSTPSSHISRKPINLFNDDDDDVFKHLIIAGRKRNDPAVRSQKTDSIERTKTALEKTSTQKTSVDAVNSNRISNSIFSDKTEEGLFNSPVLPKLILVDDSHKSNEASPSAFSKTPKNLFDDDDDDDDFLSAFVKKQKLHVSTPLIPGGGENVENSSILKDSGQTNTQDIFGSTKGNISKNKNINLFDDRENANEANNNEQREISKINEDRKEETKIKQSLSNILKSTNLFDDDEDDDDFFKTKSSICTPEKIVYKEVDELRQEKDSQKATLKSETLMNDKSDLAAAKATKEYTNSSLNRNTIKLFDDIEHENILIINTLSSSQSSETTKSESDSKKASFPIQYNMLGNEHEISVKNTMSSGDAKMPISTSSEEANIMNDRGKYDLDIENNSISVKSPPTSTNDPDVKILNILDKEENSIKNSEQTNAAVEQNGGAVSDTKTTPVEEMIQNNAPMLNQSANEQSSNNLILESGNILQDNKEEESVSKMYDFNSSLIFDEPPDDNDFFETLGKSSQNPNTKFNSFDLENDLYPEPDLPITPTAEKSLEYKGLQLFSDIPPEDNDFGNIVPQATEYTKRLNSVFYDDFNETLQALGRNQDQAMSAPTSFNKEPPAVDADKRKLKKPVDVVNSNQGDVVDHEIQCDQSSIEDLSSQTRQISKLQLPNININVHALLPDKHGRKSSSKRVQKNNEEAEKTMSAQQPTFTNDGIRTPETDHILPSVNKNRVRAPPNRRPSTRKARQENYRKSLVEDEPANTDDDEKPQDKEVRAEKKTANGNQIQSKEGVKISDILASSSTNIFEDNDKFLNTTTLPSSVVSDGMSSFNTNTKNSLVTFFDEDDDDNKLFQSISSYKAPTALQHGVTKSVLPSMDVPTSSSVAAQLSNKATTVNSKIKTSSKIMFADSDESDDDLFAKLGSSKPITTISKTEKPTILAKSTSDASKKHTSLFSDDDSDEDDFLKISAKRNIPKVSSHTNNRSIFSDIDSDDGDLFEASRKVTNNQTPNARLQSEQPTKHSIADNNPLADLL